MPIVHMNWAGCIKDTINKINSTQIQNVQESVPLTRFWQISQIPKIGQTTYEKIYRYCKDAVENGVISQLSLFDNME